MNAGLPPTPIAMVGREAIHAALNPVEGSSLYFVARGDGSHVFSDDLDAHNNAVREYQIKRRADYRSSPAPISAPETPVEEPAASASEDAEMPVPTASPDTDPDASPRVQPQDPAPEPAPDAPDAPASDASTPQSSQ